MEPKGEFIDFTARTTSAFNAILEIMFHSRKDDGTRFLRTMNNVLDYVLDTSNGNGSVNYQIIHVPGCPEWARELLIRFTIHKAALTLNKTTLKKFPAIFKAVTRLTESQGTKDLLHIKRRKDYFRKIYKLFDVAELPANSNKSLIITKEQDLKSSKSDKNPWITEFFSDRINDDDHNVTVSTGLSAFELEKTIRRLESLGVPCVENIFLFHSPNKSKITNSYNIAQLERLNRYGLAIKNCIIFSFSEHPFRLYSTRDNIKCRLASSVLNKTINKYDDFDGFITFTQDETDYLFNRDYNQESLFIDCQDRMLLTHEIDQLFEQLSHNLRYKNNLALSLCEDSQASISKKIAEENPDLSVDQLGVFFNLNQQLWQTKAKSDIEAFIGDSHRVGIVVPKDLDNSIKQSIVRLYKTPNRAIKCFSLEGIKSGIKVEKLIVLQFRYTDKFYKSYPNSFDPLPLTEEQSALVVINMLTHSNYYEWNRHWYDKDKHGLLYSTFRKTHLGWQKRTFKRPTLTNINDYINEAESDAREYQAEKCKVFYKNGGRAKEYLACDRALYDAGSLLYIGTLKEISLLEDVSLQMIDDIINKVKALISEQSEEKTNAEALYRRNPKFKLSPEEVNSSVELWKILLKREVSTKGEQAVYEALFSSIPASERVSPHTFNRWHSFDNDMILPRSRKHQKALLIYLESELGPTYYRLILAKKLSSISNSRQLNSQIETLLQGILISDIDERRFNALSEAHTDIFTLLGIDSIADLKTLISLLDISLTPIEKIEYDQD